MDRRTERLNLHPKLAVMVEHKSKALTLYMQHIDLISIDLKDSSDAYPGSYF